MCTRKNPIPSLIETRQVLNRVLLEGECVLIKHHPLRPWLDQPYGVVLAPLLEMGVVGQIRDAGLEENSRALVRNALVGHVHITGSEATYRAVLADVAATGATVTAELGCVTPWIVAPGEWTLKEIKSAARALVRQT